MRELMGHGSWLMQPLQGVLNPSLDLLLRYESGDPDIIMVDVDIFNKYWSSSAKMGDRQQSLAEKQAERSNEA